MQTKQDDHPVPTPDANMRHKHAAQNRPATGWIFTLVLFIAGPLLAIQLGGLFFEDPPPNDHKAWIRGAIRTNNPHRESRAWAALIEEEPDKPSHHFRYIEAIFESMETHEGEDKRLAELLENYRQKAESHDIQTADIGYLGLALIDYHQDEFSCCLRQLQKIKTNDLGCVSCIEGMALDKLGRYDLAEAAFRREIEKKRFIRSATWKLSVLLHERHQWSAIGDLMADETTAPHIPQTIILEYDVHNGRWVAYLQGLIHRSWTYLNRAGFLAAILITVVWMAYLRYLDLFEPEKLRYLLVTFFGGALAAFLILPVYHVSSVFLDFHDTGNWWNDFLYFVFGVGLFEETAKVIPFLLMVRFTKQVNESVDYIIYASVSALGFAFTENLIKFDEFSLFSISARGMVCVVGHMFYTSMIGYGIVLAKYKHLGTVRGNFVLAFFAACLGHGVYDFVISDSVLKEVHMLFFPIVLGEVTLYGVIMNTALNQSEFFNQHISDKFKRLRMRLALSLLAIVLFEFFALASQNGPTLAKARFIGGMPFVAFWIWILSVSLGTVKLRKGYWIPIGSRQSNSPQDVCSNECKTRT